jgi:hypothetical protein
MPQRVRSAWDAILGELTSYYNADGPNLTPDWTLTRPVAACAAESALRLRHALGHDRMPEIIALLRELAADRLHPLHAVIAIDTQVDWYLADQRWGILHTLLRATAGALEDDDVS